MTPAGDHISPRRPKIRQIPQHLSYIGVNDTWALEGEAIDELTATFQILITQVHVRDHNKQCFYQFPQKS